jgi:hypothetical protein
MNSDATQVCYSNNRFVLGLGSLRSYLESLQKLSLAGLRSMRALHLILDLQSQSALDPRLLTGPCTASRISLIWACWNSLIEFIAKSCDLAQLHLSIDMGYYGYYGFEADGWSDPDSLPAIHTTGPLEKFVEPFKQLHGLKSFHIFLSDDNAAVEAKAERIAMGESYNSLDDGKPSFEDRGVPKLDACGYPTMFPESGIQVWLW